MDTKQNDYTPIDVGAPILIPQGNLSDNPGSYASIKKAFDAAESGLKFTSTSSLHPDFKPGADFLPGDWQTMSNTTASKK